MVRDRLRLFKGHCSVAGKRLRSCGKKMTLVTGEEKTVETQFFLAILMIRHLK